MATGEIETYLYLLSASIEDSPEQQQAYDTVGLFFDVTYISTFRPLNTADYDGTTTYTFEIVCRNKSEVNSGYAYVVDENDTVLGTIEVPMNTWGAIGHTSAGGETRASGHTGADWFRYSVSFTPTAGNHQVGLRVRLPSTEWQDGWQSVDSVFKIAQAVVVIHQTDPTKSGIHIPMMTNVNIGMSNSHNIPCGIHIISDGQESLINNLTAIENYADCEVPEDFEAQSRQIWKFEESELKTVNRFVFDAGMGYYPPTVVPSSVSITGTPDLSWVRAGLRWSVVDAGTGSKELSGTYTTAVVQDDYGNDYTLVDGSDVTWFYDDDGNTWSVRQYLDIASLNAADGHYLYVAANENTYSGEGGSGAYHHWGRFRAFSIPAGRTVTSAWLDYRVYYDAGRGDEIFKVTFKYVLDNEINPGYIMLYDKTADAYVAGSELIWNAFTPWERKTVELGADLFISGHEYMARWKCPQIIVDISADPWVSDVNLSAFVTNMTEFTSWRQVTKNSMENFHYGAVYTDWGARPPGFNVTAYGGGLEIYCRGKLFKPANAEVYHECCGWVWTGGQMNEAYLGYPTSWIRTSVWDTGTTDNAIGIATSEETTQSALTWDLDAADGLTYRQRSGDIAPYVADQNRYVSYQPLEHGWYWMLAGFLIVHYALNPAGSASLSPSQSPSISPSRSPSVSPSLSPSASPSAAATSPINPYVMLTWSDDGGMTWSNEYWRPVGRIGEHRKRLIWRQLGRAKDRVFKIAVSDPCKWIFIDSIIDADEGTSRR